MIAKGSDKLKAYVGSTGVDKMYLGNTLVYSGSSEEEVPFDIPYITDGLVFCVDGLNKGGVSNSWKDWVSETYIPSVGNVTKLSNGWYFNGSTSYFESTGFTFAGSNQYTSEVVITPDEQASDVCVFCTQQGQSSNRWKPIFKIYTNGYLHVNTYIKNATIWAKDADLYNGIHTIGGNISRSYSNGVALTKASTSGTRQPLEGQDGKILIGCAKRNNIKEKEYQGIIHAIRIYNRQLTAEEILYNQSIDNARYNIGLNI